MQTGRFWLIGGALAAAVAACGVSTSEPAGPAVAIGQPAPTSKPTEFPNDDGSLKFVVLGDWLHEQLVRGHVTYVSWAEMRALRGGTARRLLVYLDAERFGTQALAEVHRRGVERAQTVAAGRRTHQPLTNDPSPLPSCTDCSESARLFTSPTLMTAKNQSWPPR